ncbi:hypothetical protein IKI14_07335 [bacterium]|nr:hypothetical protein [bacterium]
MSSQVVFNMPARDVTATPLSSVIEYNIIYSNVDEVTNPTTYTVETETFTLNEPTRTGYNFV